MINGKDQKATVELKCPRCESVVRSTDKNCQNCGEPILEQLDFILLKLAASVLNKIKNVRLCKFNMEIEEAEEKTDFKKHKKFKPTSKSAILLTNLVRKIEDEIRNDMPGDFSYITLLTNEEIDNHSYIGEKYEFVFRLINDMSLVIVENFRELQSKLDEIHDKLHTPQKSVMNVVLPIYKLWDIYHERMAQVYNFKLPWKDTDGN